MNVKRKQQSTAVRKTRSAPGAGPGHKGQREHGSPTQVGATPAQRVERYLSLAREAEAVGDVVQSQYYYQYAEHYLRKENAKAGLTALSDESGRAG